MRRALILTAAFAALWVAPAMAQSQPQQRPGEAAGLRYLGWSGRTTDTVARGPQTASTSGLRRPAAVIPHAGVGAPPLTAASAVVSAPRTPDRVRRDGLTPATAWLVPDGEAPAPTPARAQPEYPPERPTAPAPVRAAPTPTGPAPVEQAPVPQPTPEPVRTLPDVPEFDPADPMAPRRDAPIFRMQQPAQPQGASASVQQPQQQMAQADAPPHQTARYYSVHRPTGRQPDPVSLPEQVTLDELRLPEMPSGADLSEPQAGPTLMRNADGRLVPVPGQDQDPQ